MTFDQQCFYLLRAHPFCTHSLLGIFKQSPNWGKGGGEGRWRKDSWERNIGLKYRWKTARKTERNNVFGQNETTSHSVLQNNQNIGETWTCMHLNLAKCCSWTCDRCWKKQAIRAGTGKQNSTPAGTSNIEELGGRWATLKWLRVFPWHSWDIYLNNVQIHTWVSRDLYGGWEDDRVKFPSLLRGVVIAREGEKGRRDKEIIGGGG